MAMGAAVQYATKPEPASYIRYSQRQGTLLANSYRAASNIINRHYFNAEDWIFEPLERRLTSSKVALVIATCDRWQAVAFRPLECGLGVELGGFARIFTVSAPILQLLLCGSRAVKSGEVAHCLVLCVATFGFLGFVLVNAIGYLALAELSDRIEDAAIEQDASDESKMRLIALLFGQQAAGPCTILATRALGFSWDLIISGTISCLIPAFMVVIMFAHWDAGKLIAEKERSEEIEAIEEYEAAQELTIIRLQDEHKDLQSKLHRSEFSYNRMKTFREWDNAMLDQMTLNLNAQYQISVELHRKLNKSMQQALQLKADVSSRDTFIADTHRTLYASKQEVNQLMGDVKRGEDIIESMQESVHSKDMSFQVLERQKHEVMDLCDGMKNTVSGLRQRLDDQAATHGRQLNVMTRQWLDSCHAIRKEHEAKIKALEEQCEAYRHDLELAHQGISRLLAFNHGSSLDLGAQQDIKGEEIYDAQPIDRSPRTVTEAENDARERSDVNSVLSGYQTADESDNEDDTDANWSDCSLGSICDGSTVSDIGSWSDVDIEQSEEDKIYEMPVDAESITYGAHRASQEFYVEGYT